MIMIVCENEMSFLVKGEERQLLQAFLFSLLWGAELDFGLVNGEMGREPWSCYVALATTQTFSANEQVQIIYTCGGRMGLGVRRRMEASPLQKQCRVTMGVCCFFSSLFSLFCVFVVMAHRQRDKKKKSADDLMIGAKQNRCRLLPMCCLPPLFLQQQQQQQH